MKSLVAALLLSIAPIAAADVWFPRGLIESRANLLYCQRVGCTMTGALTANAAAGVVFPGSTSGTATVKAPAIAGTSAITLPNASSTLPIFGQQITFTGPTVPRSIALPDEAFTVVGLATTQALSGKTLDLTSNTLIATSLQLATAITNESGSGSALFGTSPTIITPSINDLRGVSRVTSVNTLAPTAAATGMGNSAVTVGTGSSDFAGELAMNSGAGPSASGTVGLTFSSAFGTNTPVCVAQLASGVDAWNARATVRITAASTTAVTFAWDNNAVTPTISTSGVLRIFYHCVGK